MSKSPMRRGPKPGRRAHKAAKVAPSGVAITRAPDGRPLHMEIGSQRLGAALNAWFQRLVTAHNARSAIGGAQPRERFRRKLAAIGAAEFLMSIGIDGPYVEPYWDELIDLVDVDQNIEPPAFAVVTASNREPSAARMARAFIAATVKTRYYLMLAEGKAKNQERAAEESEHDIAEALQAVALQRGLDPVSLNIDAALPGQVDAMGRPKVPAATRVYNCFGEFHRNKAPDGSMAGAEDWPLYFFRTSVLGLEQLAATKQADALRSRYWALIDRSVGRLIQLADIRRGGSSTGDGSSSTAEDGAENPIMH